MRSISLIAVLSLVAGASAQTTTTDTFLTQNEQNLQGMLQRLRDRSYDPETGIFGLFINMAGTVRVGNNVQTTPAAWLYYRYAPAGVYSDRADLKLNLRNFTTNAKGISTTDSEIVEDGRTMWQYFPPTRTYSASAYEVSSANSATSANYLKNGLLVANQASVSTGGPSYATRMLQEMFADPNGVKYRSWIPTIGGPTIGSGVYRDPLTRLYRDPLTGYELVDAPAGDPNIYYIYYDGLPRRAIAFEIYVAPGLAVGDPDRESIQRIYITETATPNKPWDKTRFISWSLSMLPTTDFSAARFTSVGPSDLADWPQWRPLVSASPVKG